MSRHTTHQVIKNHRNNQNVAVPASQSIRPTAISIAIHIALFGTVFMSAGWGTSAQAQSTSPVVVEGIASANARTYAIPAGPLDEVLAKFTGESGALLAVTPGIVSGRQSPGLHGTYNVTAAMQALLQGTGLRAVAKNSREFTLEIIPFVGEQGTALPEVTVKAQTNNTTTEGTGSYTSAQVSMLKGAQALKDIPQTVSVVTHQQMEDQNLDTLDKVLDMAPGIYKESMGSDISRKDSSATLYSRGAIIRSYMIDGVAVNAIDLSDRSNGAYQNSSINGSSAIYDRMEVLRGAAGLLIGQGAPGGTVNLVRKRPTKEFQLSTQVSAGSYDSYHAQGDVSGSLSQAGDVRGRLVVDYDRSGRHWSHTPTKSTAPLVYGMIDWDVAPATRIGIGARYEEYNEDAPPRGYYQADWGYRNTTEKEVFADIKHDFGGRWQFNGSVKHQEFDFDFLTTKVYRPGMPAKFTEVQSRYWNTKTDALDASVTGAFDLLGREHKVTFGANVSAEKGTIRRREIYSEFGDFTSSFDPNNYDQQATWGDAYTKVAELQASVRTQSPSITETKQYGVYGKLDAKLTERLTAVMGGRMSWYKQDALYGDGSIDPYSGNTNAFTPYFGLVYALTPDWSAYASYTDIFRPQFNFWTRDGQLLKHVIGTNYEAGIKGMLAGGRINTAFAIYQIDEKNGAVADDPPFDQTCAGNPTGYGCFLSVGHTRIRGFDAEISGEVLQNLNLAASYTYLHSEVIKGAEGAVGHLENKGVGLTPPKHLVKLSGSYAFRQGSLNGLSVGLAGTVQSARTLNTSLIKNYTFGGYTTWNVFAKYDLSKNTLLRLNIDNLLNKKIIAQHNENALDTLYPGQYDYMDDSHFAPGRNFMLTLVTKF